MFGRAKDNVPAPRQCSVYSVGSALYILYVCMRSSIFVVHIGTAYLCADGVCDIFTTLSATQYVCF